jgi:DNA polymerase III delta subunit
MNFTQWQGYVKKQDVSKITYVCGEQSTLVEIVIDNIKSILDVSVTDFVEVNYEADVWELASKYSVNPDINRLTVVRNAEKFTDWEGLIEWLANSRNNPKNYLLFVSELSDAPGIFSKGKKVSYEDYIEVIRTKGKLIKCSTPNEDDLLKWVESYGLTKQSANFLIDRTSGDISSLHEILKKVHIWNGSPNAQALKLLCDEQVTDSFVDYLILRDKSSAYLALQNMSEEEKTKAITQLEYRLDFLLEIGSYVRRRVYDVDIASATGFKIYLIKKFKGIVKEYTNTKIKYCRQILAMIDQANRDGAKIGTMEALITLW